MAHFLFTLPHIPGMKKHWEKECALIGSEQTREKGAARVELPEGAVIDLSLCRLADRLGSHPNDFVFVKT